MNISSVWYRTNRGPIDKSEYRLSKEEIMTELHITGFTPIKIVREWAMRHKVNAPIIRVGNKELGVSEFYSRYKGMAVHGVINANN